MAFGIAELRHHLDQRLDQISAQLAALESEIKKMAASVQDLDDALTAFEQATTSAENEINAAVTAILAKVGPGVDLTPEIGRLKAVSSGLQSAADNIQAQANPTPPPTP